ncbi:retrotransposon protein, putative, ty1-copia subclass [Tanacetum coccineum]
MHNVGKTIGELHAMLIEYENGLPKKAKTPQVMMIKGSCHYAPSITRVSKNNVHYFNAIPSNGIYEIDMHDLVPNVNSIYNVSTKRAKHNLDSTYLWHYRLAHISKKRIEKLQQEGLLKSTDDESFDQCVSCLSGKMTRKSFPHRPERATDLLGIIHTDVCGPLRHVSRQGASYFITLRDDYSRYGYVYLLKHKHEVFETFKVFKNKVENQLGKTIKALRSDRGGEYISQEFKDYLKDCGIVQQLTPSYTPQHNGVSERRNHTLLNMGCEALVKRDTPDKLQQRSAKTRRAPNRLSLNVEVEEHSLGDLNEPTSYKAAMFDSESNMWIDAMNAEIQFMMDNMVWVLVDLPNGCFVDPNHPRKVCKLQRSIYGLKQASRSWNKRFDEEIKRFGFTQNLDEPCVYQKASGSNVTFLILYVDDIIIMGNHIPSLQSVKDYLGKCFAMKDLGEAAFILGIKIYRDRSKRLIGLGQNAYMDKILKRYRMDNSKRGHIPMQERLDLNKTQGASTPKEVKRMQNVPYASAVGSIMYVTAVKNILKYLRNTKDMFLVYGGNPEAELRVDCYCDAGFETDRDDTKSQTGYVFILNGGAVDWKSSKQSTTAMSATEAEYIAASEAAMEAVWIRKFISGLGIVPTINEPIRMFCDNSAALHFANEPGVQRGARHYHRRYHYVRECIALGEIRFLKVHTDDNLADPFTKALSKGKLTQHARSMGLRLASSFM